MTPIDTEFFMNNYKVYYGVIKFIELTLVYKY